MCRCMYMSMCIPSGLDASVGRTHGSGIALGIALGTALEGGGGEGGSRDEAGGSTEGSRAVVEGSRAVVEGSREVGRW